MGDDYHEEKAYNRKRWALLIISILVFIATVALFAVCIWIRFDLDFWEWVVEIDWYTYWYCVYFIMVTLILVAITHVLLIYGVLFEVSGAVTACIFLIIACFIMEFIGAIIICVFGVEESDVLIAQLNEVFLGLIYRMQWDDRARRILGIIQEYVRCCGADGSNDYINAHKPVPWECRDRVIGSEYAYGCRQSFAWYIEPWSATLAGGLAVFMLFHVVQLVLMYKLLQYLRRNNSEYEKGGYYAED